jgi:hypothetical protein
MEALLDASKTRRGFGVKFKRLEGALRESAGYDPLFRRAAS